MKISILFFGTARLLAGREESTLDLALGATVGEAFATLVVGNSKLRELEKCLRFAVDMEYATPSTLLREGQTLALIPPVQGG